MTDLMLRRRVSAVSKHEVKQAGSLQLPARLVARKSWKASQDWVSATLR